MFSCVSIQKGKKKWHNSAVHWSDHVYDLTLTKQGNVTVNSDVTQTSFFSILAISIPIEGQRLKS